MDWSIYPTSCLLRCCTVENECQLSLVANSERTDGHFRRVTGCLLVTFGLKPLEKSVIVTAQSSSSSIRESILCGRDCNKVEASSQSPSVKKLFPVKSRSAVRRWVESLTASGAEWASHAERDEEAAAIQWARCTSKDRHDLTAETGSRQ